jgi:hypothetical protein
MIGDRGTHSGCALDACGNSETMDLLFRFHNGAGTEENPIPVINPCIRRGIAIASIT